MLPKDFAKTAQSGGFYFSVSPQIQQLFDNWKNKKFHHFSHEMQLHKTIRTLFPSIAQGGIIASANNFGYPIRMSSVLAVVAFSYGTGNGKPFGIDSVNATYADLSANGRTNCSIIVFGI